MSTSIRLMRATALAVLTLTAACATAPKRGADGGAAAPLGDPNVLTAAEVESRGAPTGSMYDVLQRMRPGFLRSRGLAGSTADAGTVHVSIDGGSLRDLTALRSLPASQVAEVRYLSAASAAQRFGTSASNGPVLLVRSK